MVGQQDVASPCAACKMLRRRCRRDECVLAPHFSPNDSQKFAVVHRVFGASNIIKVLEILPSDKRDDAVTSMVYEANARLRDPVYGCTGAIYQLQQQLSQLQAQLANAQAELLRMHWQQVNLVAAIKESVQPLFPIDQIVFQESCADQTVSEDQDPLMDLWEPLWTI